MMKERLTTEDMAKGEEEKQPRIYTDEHG